MTDKPRTLKQRIKAHKPAIVALAGTAAAVTTYVYFVRKNSTDPSAFFKNAADPTVEIILGNDDAFVVMTEAAAEHLREFNTLPLHEGNAGIFTLMFAEPKM